MEDTYPNHATLPEAQEPREASAPGAILVSPGLYTLPGSRVPMTDAAVLQPLDVTVQVAQVQSGKGCASISHAAVRIQPPGGGAPPSSSST